MASYLQDLRFAVRTLCKRPGFTLVVVLILGLGIGAATAVIDLVNLLAWRTLPVERPEELVKVFSASHRGWVGPYHPTSYRDYVDYRDGNRSFSGLAAHHDFEARLDTGESTEVVTASAVSGNFFEVLKLGVTAGRPLSDVDDRPDSSPAMVIAHSFWERLGRDPEVLGRTMTVEGEAFTVVGVGPAGYTSTMAGSVTDFFIPAAAMPRFPGNADFLEDRATARFYVTGRLQPGATHAAAQAELDVLARQIDADHPMDEDAKRQITTTAANVVHPVDLQRMVPSLRLFAAAVALLFIITCANIAHLLLARSAARRREMAVRQSMGAGRWLLVRQLLTENLLLALGGGLCGLLLAYWARSFLVAFGGSEFAGEMRFDVRVLGASFLVCLVATLLFGLAPALSTSRVDLVSALKEGTSDGGGRRRFSAGQLLSVAQVAFCVVLLAAGALLGQSVWNRLNADLGFDDENLVIARLHLPQEEYSREEGKVFVRQLRERAAALPTVEDAGVAWVVPPLLFDLTLPFHLPEDPDNARTSRVNLVDEGYFRAMGITLEQGRLFNGGDADSGKAVAVVNRFMAEQLWPGENPLGRTIRSAPTKPGDPGPDYEVIGVVGSVGQHRSGLDGEPVIYYSADQRYRPRFQLVTRSTAETSLVVESLRGLLREMDPALALTAVRTGEMNRRDAFTFERMQAMAVGVFAVLGFLLALLGIFGVLSYAVSRQVREVGIRMALGARRLDVLSRVVRQGMTLALAGAGIGLVGTFLSSRLLENLLFGVTASDVRVLGAVVASVLAAAFVAAYLPARRASRLDPLKALRYE